MDLDETTGSRGLLSLIASVPLTVLLTAVLILVAAGFGGPVEWFGVVLSVVGVVALFSALSISKGAGDWSVDGSHSSHGEMVWSLRRFGLASSAFGVATLTVWVAATAIAGAT